MIKKTVILMFGLLFSLNVWALDANKKRYSDRKEVRQFINNMVVKHQFNQAELLKLFRGAKYQKAVIEAYKRPAERSLTWTEYRRIFVQKKRVDLGVKFYKTHAQSLKQAEKETGVPAAMLVAIIGVESRFGKHKGKNPVFDSLVTLSFDREKRSAFFKNELAEFLLLCKEQGFKPLELKGSYAGAMGMPQFISSSYRNYAVDGDGDKKINLFSSHKDVIFSVANYFKRHHWQSGQPVISPAMVKDLAKVKAKVIGKGRYNLDADVLWKTYQKQGVSSSSTIKASDKVALMWLDDGKQGHYKLVHHNFYVITRYNQSSMYALAAYQLSQKIEAQYQAAEIKRAKEKARVKSEKAVAKQPENASNE